MSKAPLRHKATAVRPLNPLDVCRYALLGEPGGSERAYTLGSLRKEKLPTFETVSVSRAGLSPRGRRCACVWHRGSRVIGLATAGRRSGPQSWEITHLFLEPGIDSPDPELLDEVSRQVASHGGKRIFLRLRHDDPLVDAARLSGFFPCVPEVLYKGMPRQGEGGGHAFPNDASRSLRRKQPRDDYDIFRLYCAATPSEVRAVSGMTFDQWAASREQGRGRSQEFVSDKNGEVSAWLRCTRQWGTAQLEVMVHPDHEPGMGSVVDFGLERLRGSKAVYCLAPRYQTALQRILEYRGFEASSEYVTVVKSMVVDAKEDARVRVNAASC